MKHRIEKTSIVICCEGQTEVAFLKYIKDLYIDGINKSVRIRSASGGGLKSIERTIKKHNTQSAFAQCYGFLDMDLINTSENLGENILTSKPCIEGFFLELLDKHKPLNSKECKKQFEEQFLNKKEKLKHKNYERIFKEPLLDKKRKTNDLLDKILKIFE